MASYQQEYFEINNVFTIETVVVSFVLEDGGIYIIILLRNEPVFLSLEKAYIGELRHFSQWLHAELALCSVSSPGEVRFSSFFLVALVNFIYSFVHLFIHSLI